MQNQHKRDKMNPPAAKCKRCGTCCRKGGPAFHHQDMDLIEKGEILLKDIYTIRKGEVASDNVRGALICAQTDIIKIKSRPGSSICIFLDQAQNTCAVYDHRPIECRTLTCWDTCEIERLYEKDRLTRKDLLKDTGGLWDLVADHQIRCDPVALKEYIDRLKAPENERAIASILKMLAFDTQLRQVIADKAGLDANMMEFLLGRPLADTFKALGIKLIKEHDRRHLEYQGVRYPAAEH